MKLIASPARLSTVSATFDAEFKARLHWSADTDAAIEQRVADILADVRKRGDAAVLEYTRRFDGLAAESMAQLELTQADFQQAFDSLPAAQRDALRAAADRVRSYHEAQKKASGNTFTARGMPLNIFAFVVIVGGGSVIMATSLRKLYYGIGKIEK